MQIVKYVFQPHGDERGQLVALEEFKDIPFRIKRVYYMYNTVAGVVRGNHAHKSLQQILICIHGSCKVRLDNGKDQRYLHLEMPYLKADTYTIRIYYYQSSTELGELEITAYEDVDSDIFILE